MRATDVRVCDVAMSYEDFRYRTPIKFGGVALDRATVLNVNVTVESRTGQRAVGFGSMPLGNVWAFPSKKLSYLETLAAMKSVAEKIASILPGPEWGHPIDLNHSHEPRFFEIAGCVECTEAIPKLATLVAASPFDAAIHDAFGKLHGRNCYHTYGNDLWDDDLGRFLGPEFAGETLAPCLSRAPQAEMPLYHLVGALDPLTEVDVHQRVGDGLPETLAEWIAFNGLTHLKIKLNGDDIGWDVERVVGVNTVAESAAAQRTKFLRYSLDFNERCSHVSYLIEFLHKLGERSPSALIRVQYIEQPTARDLAANPDNRMHAAAQLRPIVIDESLVDLESLRLARDMGYTGVALKACKGQSQSLLMAAAARKFGLFLCVQDLTCPGASLIHSAGLAAHVVGVAAIEANARQYMPVANQPWEERFPGIFRVSNGTLRTSELTGLGLGAVPPTS